MTITAAAMLPLINITSATARLTAVSSYAWQMTAVAIILLLCLTWLVVKIRKRMRSGDRSSCCGCSLSDACAASSKKSPCPK